jgi:hypothetical protein
MRVLGDQTETSMANKHNNDFETMSLEGYLVKYLLIYPKVEEESLCLIIPFSSAHLCKSGFSTLIVIKKNSAISWKWEVTCIVLPSFKPKIF